MAIGGPPWNNMPMQVGRLIAKAGKVDFVGLKQGTQSALNAKYDGHEMTTMKRRKVGHFLHVLRPNSAAKPGIVGIRDENNA
jgi:hypothetical protein